MTGRVAGKVVLITGGASGLGAAAARLLASEGATVVVADVAEELGRETTAAIVRAGGRASFVPLDVSDPDRWGAVVAGIEDDFDALHVLVNNAAVLGNGTVETTTLEQWHRLIAVNQTGAFLGMRAVAPVMRRSGGGSIINVSSTAGLVGMEQLAAYQATKGAIRLLTKGAAIDLAADGIRANSLHPGRMATPMAVGSGPRLDAVILSTPLQRAADPSEIANGVLFLASDESSYMTGAELTMDGGYTAR